MFFPLVLAIFSNHDLKNAKSCLTGTWLAENKCPFLSEKFKIKVSSSFASSDFHIDISPSNWNHSNLHILSLKNKKDNLFELTDNRFNLISNLNLYFEPRCGLHTSLVNLSVNHSLFGNINSGSGFIAYTSPESEPCKIFITKKIEYSSYSFSLTFFFGVLCMFIAFQTYYGWNESELVQPKKIPIDNPGEEKVLPDEEQEKDVSSSDSFESSDGY